MALREYKCECGHKKEEIQPISQEPSPTSLCPLCGRQAALVKFSASNLALSSFQEAPLDIKVGADASRKWQMYHDRQEERNKVRSETGSMGLTELAPGHYIPIPEGRREVREIGAAARKNGVPQDPEML